MHTMKKHCKMMVDWGGFRVGTDVYRDPALELLKRAWSNGSSLTDTHGWDAVRFPIVFHLQWDNNLTKSGKPRMLFHTSYDAWRMVTGIAMALCGPNPPVQVSFLFTPQCKRGKHHGWSGTP